LKFRSTCQTHRDRANTTIFNLINRMQQVATALAQSGAAKPASRPGT